MELFEYLQLEKGYEEIIFELNNNSSNWNFILPTDKVKEECIKSYYDKIKHLHIKYKYLYN